MTDYNENANCSLQLEYVAEMAAANRDVNDSWK